MWEYRRDDLNHQGGVFRENPKKMFFPYEYLLHTTFENIQLCFLNLQEDGIRIKVDAMDNNGANEMKKNQLLPS